MLPLGQIVQHYGLSLHCYAHDIRLKLITKPSNPKSCEFLLDVDDVWISKSANIYYLKDISSLRSLLPDCSAETPFMILLPPAWTTAVVSCLD